MYRIVFKSLAPKTRLLDVQYGPWHPTPEMAERWIDYFKSLGHPAQMLIEERNSGIPASSLTRVA